MWSLVWVALTMVVLGAPSWAWLTYAAAAAWYVAGAAMSALASMHMQNQIGRVPAKGSRFLVTLAGPIGWVALPFFAVAGSARKARKRPSDAPTQPTTRGKGRGPKRREGRQSSAAVN